MKLYLEATGLVEVGTSVKLHHFVRYACLCSKAKTVLQKILLHISRSVSFVLQRKYWHVIFFI